MIYILFGAISGIISSMGMGGGTILIYLLTAISGIEQHIAQGINLVFFVPTCIVSIIINLKNKNIQKNTAIIVSGIIGATIGAKISLKMNVNELRKYFGVFLIGIAIYQIYLLIKSYIKFKKANNKNKKIEP